MKTALKTVLEVGGQAIFFDCGRDNLSRPGCLVRGTLVGGIKGSPERHRTSRNGNTALAFCDSL
jgi:hypothetical protein